MDVHLIARQERNMLGILSLFFFSYSKMWWIITDNGFVYSQLPVNEIGCDDIKSCQFLVVGSFIGQCVEFDYFYPAVAMDGVS